MSTDGDQSRDPSLRYSLDGHFDVDCFEGDLSNFPDFFDENGWPLFGEYDPYALTHPITGNPWHWSPRVPREVEETQTTQIGFGWRPDLNPSEHN